MNEQILKSLLYIFAILALLSVIAYFGVNTFHKLQGDIPVSKNNEYSNLMPTDLQADLIGKSIFNWKKINSTDMLDCKVLGKTEDSKNTVYQIASPMDNKQSDKPTYYLDMVYNEQGLTKIITKKIVYDNPVDEHGYPFAPLKNCKIYICTYGKDILLKTCETCSESIINVAEEDNKELPATDYIQISTKDPTAKHVQFTYIPFVGEVSVII